MTRKVLLMRDTFYDTRATMGCCYVLDENDQVLFFTHASLERGWRDNQANVSCMPTGAYELKLEWSPSFRKDLWEVYGVPGRSEIKFHVANYWSQLNGCVSLGNNRAKPNHHSGGLPWVTSSGQTMRDFHQAMDGFKKAIMLVQDIRTLL